MKYLKYIFVLLLSLAVLPFAVNAEAKPDAEIKDTDEVKVYSFLNSLIIFSIYKNAILPLIKGYLLMLPSLASRQY